MGVVNEYDSGTPFRFIWEHLSVDTAFQNLYTNKFFERVRIPSKPGDMFCYVPPIQSTPLLWGGTAEYIGKMSANAEVICVRKYPTGKGTEMDFRESIKILRRVLCGQRGVNVSDANGDIIGVVDETRFVTETVLLSVTDGTFDILHKGIKFYMSYRPPES